MPKKTSENAELYRMTNPYSYKADSDRIVEVIKTFDFANLDDVEVKINCQCVLLYMRDECYRENMVSFVPMRPLLELPQVKIEDADYIIYMNPYARCEDVSEKVEHDIRKIAEIRHENATIIVVGKATNIESKLAGSIPNIKFYKSHFCKRLGEEFGLDMTDQYFVYDEDSKHLAIWPVDGCLNKCGFCRRSYMDIPFESIPLDIIKENLNLIRNQHPEWLKVISLRAENLTQYGIDIYGKPMLHHLISLINSFDEVKEISFDIGLDIGAINDDILKALCECKKEISAWLNPEVGTDRLLNFIGKAGHSIEHTKKVFKALHEAHPNIMLYGTVMIGLPSETQNDIFELARLIGELKLRKVQINYYVLAPGHPLAKYPQISTQVRQYHLKMLLRELKKYLQDDLIVEHWDEATSLNRTKIREGEKLKQKNKTELFPRHLARKRVFLCKVGVWKDIFYLDGRILIEIEGRLYEYDAIYNLLHNK